MSNLEVGIGIEVESQLNLGCLCANFWQEVYGVLIRYLMKQIIVWARQDMQGSCI